MAFWTCRETAASAAHAHRRVHAYTLIIDGERNPLNAGQEHLIPRGVLHRGEVLAGTRTIHAFGGHRADRVQDSRFPRGLPQIFPKKVQNSSLEVGSLLSGYFLRRRNKPNCTNGMEPLSLGTI